ncbi:penicillin-binding protein, partial [Clostridiaceae bacterium UIB06]|nr:penicillin-binding protein [Clostridiaceae bacterium UIB06]
MKGDKKIEFTRYTALIIIMIIIFTAIASKLFSLQVLKAEEYKEKANNSSIREIPEAAPRGNILDKNGVLLATNDKSYVLVYNQTNESDKTFFDTMDKVFKILDESGETQQDDFELKINPFRFEFTSSDPQVQRALEIRFKKDRGLDFDIQKKLFKDKKDKLTKEDQDKIDEELLKITPEETFKKLVKQYKIDDSKYSLEEQRRFMIIKDKLKMQSFSGYKPVTVANNIKKETAFKFKQILNGLSGIDVNTEPIRTYPNGELGSAFIGYISKISTNQDKYQEKGYDVSTDYVGTSGIESVFEDRLKGSKGGRIVKLNKQGRVVEELGSREPYPGQSIQLTIDKDVQAAAEKALDEKMKELRDNPFSQNRSNTTNATRAAAVVIDVNTGAVLALASRPGFDPNLFSAPGKLPQDKYNEFFNPDLAQMGMQYIQQRGIT